MAEKIGQVRSELKNGRPKGTVKAVWQKREWQIKKKKKRSARSLRIQLKKNTLFISDGSRVINLLMKPCNFAFLQKR
jgi:hypothetical protein